MYLRILLTILQCFPLEFAMNLLTTFTACAMSSLVQIIAYIRLPTTDAYDTRDISILFASLLGLILKDEIQLIGNGVEM